MVVAVIALGLVGAGCGGSDSDTGSGTSAVIPKAEFVKSAEKVCADRGKERIGVGETINYENYETAGGKFDEAEFVDAVEKALNEKIYPSLQRQSDELEALGLPEGDEAKVERMWENLAKGVDLLEKEGITGLGGDGFDTFEKEANEYDLTCKVF
jgi:hypothetical protein